MGKKQKFETEIKRGKINIKQKYREIKETERRVGKKYEEENTKEEVFLGGKETTM